MIRNLFRLVHTTELSSHPLRTNYHPVRQSTLLRLWLLTNDFSFFFVFFSGGVSRSKTFKNNYGKTHPNQPRWIKKKIGLHRWIFGGPWQISLYRFWIFIDCQYVTCSLGSLVLDIKKSFHISHPSYSFSSWKLLQNWDSEEKC